MALDDDRIDVRSPSLPPRHLGFENARHDRSIDRSTALASIN